MSSKPAARGACLSQLSAVDGFSAFAVDENINCAKAFASSRVGWYEPLVFGRRSDSWETPLVGSASFFKDCFLQLTIVSWVGNFAPFPSGNFATFSGGSIE